MRRLRVSQRGEHGAHAAEVDLRNRDDNSQSGQLQLEIRNQKNNSDYRNQRGEIFARISFCKEIRLCLEIVLATQFPNLRQDEERDNVAEGDIGEDVQSRTAAGIGPTTRSEKGEGGV